MGQEFEKQPRLGRKALMCLGLVVPVLTVIALMPFGASGGVKVAPHDHSDHDHSVRHRAVDAAMARELAQVRRATARFHDVDEALAAGYELGWVNGSGVRMSRGCVAHPTAGAMGYHYFNAALMADNGVDALAPEVLVYAPDRDGGLKLVAVEWVVRSAQSNPPGVSAAPSVLGHGHAHPGPAAGAGVLSHPRLGLGPQPAGMFADWNPRSAASLATRVQAHVEPVAVPMWFPPGEGA